MRNFFIWLAVGILLWLITGCSSDPPATKPIPVTIQLKWVHQAQFAGFYLAQLEGYYEEEGLEVTFLEGGKNIDPWESLTEGKANFAITSPEDILLQRLQAVPLVALAAIYRRSAVVYAAHGDSGIHHPSHFAGKVAAIDMRGGGGRDFQVQFYAMLRKLGVPAEDVTTVPYDPGYSGFFTGEVDVTAAYSTGGIVKIRDKIPNIHLFWPGDYGIVFYSDTLVTMEETLANKPDLCLKLLRATIRGWQTALGNPEKAVDATMQYADSGERLIQEAMFEAARPLVQTGKGKIGEMKKVDWSHMHQILLEEDILPEPVPELERVYSLELLKSMYTGSTQ